MILDRCGLGGRFLHGRALLMCALLVIAGAAALRCGTGVSQSAGVPAAPPTFMSGQAPDRLQIRTSFAQLPMIFEANQGQTDSRVKFMARGSGYGLFLTGDEAVLKLQTTKSRQKSSVSDSVIRMQLSGASANPAVAGTDALPGTSNYFVGNDPAKWRRNVPQFARVRYHEVYPGIDLVYYGKQGKLEYDFEVAPGADPRQVAIRFQGTDQIAIDGDGQLVLKAGGGDVSFQAPRVYQKLGNEEKPVAGRFVLRGKDEAGFELGTYDRSRALVIDPVLQYSTYLGGTGDETSPSIAVDPGFNVYVSGTTTSATFPIPTGGTPPALKGPSDVFVAKLNSAGSALLFATYVGGAGTETSAGIAIDSGFNVAIAGTTDSTDFPAVNNFPTATLAAGNHGFVTEIDSSGSALLYSAYLGGNGADAATGIAVDTKNKIYVTGTTTATDFPTTTGAFQVTSLATNQFFLTKIDPSTTGVQSLVYSTYFGGGNPASGVAIGGGVAVDGSSNVYITGSTNFLHTGANATTDFPILNAAQGCLDGPTNPSPCSSSVTALDVFVAKLTPASAAGAQLQYSTYLGGTADDVATGIAVDSSGSAYVTGYTASSDFATVTNETNQVQAGYGGGTDAFLVKLGPFTVSTTSTGTVAEAYFTYIGGSSEDRGLAVAVETSTASTGGARVTGFTSSSNLPVTSGALQPASGGGTDAFLARVDTISTAHYLSYLGGSGSDRGTGIAVDPGLATYITGDTTSPNFTVSSGALQTALNGSSSDAFVTKFGPTVNLAMTAKATPTPSGVGNAVTFTYVITNNGDLTTGINFTATLSGSASLTSATTTSGSCGTATGTPPTVSCAIGALAASNATSTTASTITATVTLQLTPTSAGPLGSTATVSAGSFSTSASATATITDFAVTAAPATQSTPAGTPLSYTATVTPTGGFPNSVSLSCSAGLPTGASCTVTNNPITNLNTGAQSRALVVNSTARVTTSAQLFHGTKPFYVAWLPVSGLALFGLGGGKKKWRWLLTLVFGAFLTLTMLQAGCGSSTPSTTTSGTPAGTYTVGITATSGSASRTTTVQLVVQ